MASYDEIQQLLGKMSFRRRCRVLTILDRQEAVANSIKGYELGIERMKNKIVELNKSLDAEIAGAYEDLKLPPKKKYSRNSGSILPDLVAAQEVAPPAVPGVQFVEVPAGKLDKTGANVLEAMQIESKKRHRNQQVAAGKEESATEPPKTVAKRGRKPKTSGSGTKPAIDIAKLRAAASRPRTSSVFDDEKQEKPAFVRPPAVYSNITSPYGIASELLLEQLKK